MVGHVVYHYLRAAELGQHFDIPPELTEEEQLAVAWAGPCVFMGMQVNTQIF
jgi:hypothetical protein